MTRLQKAVAVLALAAVYVALEWISSIHEYKGLLFTAWDPGLGVLFAAIVIHPVIGIVALFLGHVAAEMLFLEGWYELPRIFALAAVVPATHWLVLRIIRKSGNFDPSLARLRDILVLQAAGVAGALISSALIVGGLLAVGALGTADIVPAAMPQAIGDIIGICVVAPLCLIYWPSLQARKFESPPPLLLDFIAFAAAVTIFSTLAASDRTREGLQYFYILFVPVVFAAVRHGLTGSLVALVCTQAALVIILDWIDADATRFTNYQTLMLVLTATGLLVGSIVSERDLARRRAQAMEWAAARAARFNLVSGMAAALSHEISQPLTAARARARTIERLIEMNDLTRTRENLPQLVAQIDRAADILQRMREFLRRGQPDRRPVNWDSLAGGAQMLIAPLATEKRIVIDWSRDENLPQVLCDRIQIEQVLINLISNAMDAIASTGRSDGRVAIHASRQKDDHALEISVRDNGSGIDPALAGNLFNAMTTTRQDGLGLGIAICASIVESHRGRLWLETSHPGNTDFRFRLPAAP